MNEQKWLCCSPREMFDFLRLQHPTPRKLRLIGCAFCRRIWPHISDSLSRVAVEVAERFVDGNATAEDLAVAQAAAEVVYQKFSSEHPDKSHEFMGRAVCSCVAECSPSYDPPFWDVVETAVANKGSYHGELDALRSIIRDIHGDPFRPVSFASSWCSPQSVELARQMYDSRVFDRMPTLAKALDDAKCMNKIVLAHCRDTKQVHVRGCWVVDLLLGKW